MMLGYYKDPEHDPRGVHGGRLVAHRRQGPLDAEGDLRIIGRVKDLFKTSKGKYVTPAPIEDKLVPHAAVEACCVTGANLGQPLALLMLNVDASQQGRAAERLGARSLSRGPPPESMRARPARALDCLVVVTRGVDGRERPR